MTVHGLRPEFQPSNLTSAQAPKESTTPEVIKATAGEHEGIPSVNAKSSELTGLGQALDIQA